MFGRNQNPRCCHSQVSKQQRGICALALTMLFVASSTSFSAEVSKEGADQTDRTNSTKTPLNYNFLTWPKNEPYTFSDFLKNLHGLYEVTLMGPRLTGASNETYNRYIPDVAPIQLYHTVELGYQVNPDFEISIKEHIVQNLADGVVGNDGTVRNHSFEYYDPEIFFKLPHLVKVEGWSVYTSFAFSLVLSQASQDIGRITALTFKQDWYANTFPSPWTYGFSLFLNPQFYADPKPEGYTDRQTLYGSFGHNFGYRISPSFALNTTTEFDFEHRSPDSQGFLHLGSALEDTFRITASVTPNVFPLFMSVSGYYQFLIWNPSIDTSIIGAGLSVGF